MRCARCGATRTTLYTVGVDGDEHESCRWCLEPDEWNRIATLEAQEEAERE